jgi:hypothetical protein
MIFHVMGYRRVRSVIRKIIEAPIRRPDVGHRGGTVAYERQMGSAGGAMKGDRVEIVVEAGGDSRTYEITATRAGRRVEVSIVRNVVTVAEVTRGGSVVRTARFMANRVLALVEHPAPRGPLSDDLAADNPT